jgi:protein-L-isoaspartate O-methyltransferase
MASSLALRAKQWTAAQIRQALKYDLDRLVSRADAEKMAQAAYHQAECYVQLHRRLPALDVLGMREWALSPDAAMTLVDLVQQHQPGLVVELGSGTSTLVLATALQQYSPSSRLVSLEHSPRYAESTRGRLDAAGLANAEVRTAELTVARTPSGSLEWYDVDAVHDLRDIALLLVDGPPNTRGRDARRPSLTHLGSRMAPGAHVVLDDADRPDEAALADSWAQLPGARRTDVPTEKGLAVVSLGANPAQASTIHS